MAKKFIDFCSYPEEWVRFLHKKGVEILLLAPKEASTARPRISAFNSSSTAMACNDCWNRPMPHAIVTERMRMDAMVAAHSLNSHSPTIQMTNSGRLLKR